MTDQEKEIDGVIKYIRSCRNAGIDTTITIDKSKNHLILNALEELQDYRAIGTVNFFKQLSEQFKPHTIDESCCKFRNCNKCDKYRMENNEYHSIGTVVECRETMEKQKAKATNI